MGRTLQWHGDAWDEYCEWQQTDKATLKRINALIKDARRDPFTGIGKPEPLKHDLSRSEEHTSELQSLSC